MRTRFLIAGASGAGKTSLIMALQGMQGKAPKTQAAVYHTRFVDMPGEYVTHPYLHKQFLSLAGQVEAILFLLSAAALPSPLPRGLLEQPRLPVHGIISKCDLPQADPEYAGRELERLGLKGPFYRISLVDERTLAPLLQLTG